ncbi:alpha-L-arabinofuranosidase C-terminal domain-containing protein [Microbacterium panaciterrae]|uniref:non-reducing end alpha-L-arabinofuranosidase n=1 Tax=Microbacterium panaciterrae TaxID=985759 RepID=A0ABP8P2Q3_9MICO
MNRPALAVIAAVAAAVMLSPGANTAFGAVSAGTGSSSTPAPVADGTPDGTVPITDAFDGATLDPHWSVVNPDPANATVSGGRLNITGQVGDTYQGNNTAKNVYFWDVPNADFTAITHVNATVSKVFQGAGMIAGSDLDNYVREGLTFVGGLSPSGVAIESDNETAGSFSSLGFEDRPASTGETLRMQRVGKTLTTSYWTGTDWKALATRALDFTVTKVGLYALGALDGTVTPASFDYFALQTGTPAPVTLPADFSLGTQGSFLALDGNRIVVAGSAQATAPVFHVVSQQNGTVQLQVAGRPVVLAGGAAVLGDAGATPTTFTAADAAGGLVSLTTDAGPLGSASGSFGIVPAALALRFTVTPVVKADASAITVQGDATLVKSSPNLYGVFYEDINDAADGGLYAELVRNRSFEFSTADNKSYTSLTAWEKLARDAGSGSTSAVVNDDGRLNDMNRNYLQIQATGAGAGIRNTGYNSGIAVQQGSSYDFSIWAKSSVAQTLTVRVEDAANATVFGTATVDVDGSGTWKTYTTTVTASGTAAAGRLAVLAGAASTLSLDMVSLFPQSTWVGPVNGKSSLRADLAQKVADLHPKFLRFPGGCVTNVGTFKSYAESGYTDRTRTYQWKETIGPVESRPTNFNFWGYNQSYGIGFLEYFEFAEDIGAAPLPVLSVGANGCGSKIPEMTDPAQVQRYVQDTLDLIEFATGDTSTHWGAIRAQLGHPKPFAMPYIGLGNEENSTTFEANFPKFQAAIKAAYPNIKVIANSGPDDSGSRFDTLWAYDKQQKADLVDEHYYNDPSWFLSHNNRYDTYDRSGPHVFLGEYASLGNTQYNAVSEAAYMTGLERNSDVVDLASYAPLFANVDNVQWAPDAIWFDNTTSWVSPDYWVQQMFSTNKGDEIVPSTQTGGLVSNPPITGGAFLSTWNTAAQFDNVSVTGSDGSSLFQDGFADASQWQSQKGTWAVQNGAYAQTATNVTDARSIIAGAYGKDWSNYTLELDAKKTAGSEGFLIGFGATSSNNFYWWNIGGWGNTRMALQKATGGAANEIAAKEGVSVTTGQTYHLKVVVNGRKISLYQDSVLMISYDDGSTQQELYNVVSRDSATGDIVVKMVNASDRTQQTTVNLNGVKVRDAGTQTVLAASKNASNSRATPDAVAPVTSAVTGLSTSSVHDLQPWSVTFLRLHTVDTVPPVITVHDLPAAVGNGWWAPGTQVTASATDNRGALASFEYRIDQGAWTPAQSATDAAAAVTGHGAHTVQFRATDADGNTTETRPTTLQIDGQGPLTRADLDPSARTVTLTAVDGESGVDHSEYRLGSGDWQRYDGAIPVGDAAVTVAYRSVDRAGNLEAFAMIDVAAANAPLAPSALTATVANSAVEAGSDVPIAVRVTASQHVTGMVSVSERDRVIGASALIDGTALLTVPRIAQGSHTFTIAYAGNAQVAASTATVTVTAAARHAELTVDLEGRTVHLGQSQVVTIGLPKDATGSMRIVVQRGDSIVQSVQAVVQDGSARVVVPADALDRKGGYRIALTYSGDDVYASTTADARFTVVKAG